MSNCFRWVSADITPEKIVFHPGIPDDQLEQHVKSTSAKIEEKDLEIHGIKYPVVRSHPIPIAFAWNDTATVVKSYMVYITSLGHSTPVFIE